MPIPPNPSVHIGFEGLFIFRLNRPANQFEIFIVKSDDHDPQMDISEISADGTTVTPLKSYDAGALARQITISIDGKNNLATHYGAEHIDPELSVAASKDYGWILDMKRIHPNLDINPANALGPIVIKDGFCYTKYLSDTSYILRRPRSTLWAGRHALRMGHYTDMYSGQLLRVDDGQGTHPFPYKANATYRICIRNICGNPRFDFKDYYDALNVPVSEQYDLLPVITGPIPPDELPQDERCPTPIPNSELFPCIIIYTGG